MTIILRLFLSAFFAIVASLLLNLANGAPLTSIEPLTIFIIFVACFSCAIISPALASAGLSTKGTSAKGRSASPRATSNGSTDSSREQGTVKWFNVSKGYGFVTRSSGEEIFVHFRSIRGEGRRALREGQSVEFTVVDGDKGPQAEDVEAL